MDVKKGCLNGISQPPCFVGLLIRTTEKYPCQCTNSVPVFSVIKAGIRNRIKRDLYMLSLYIRNLIYVDYVVNIYS